MSKDYNLHANLSEELRFLVNCCKTDPSNDDTTKILSYLNSPNLDISTLIQLATQHGILPLVYKTIKKLSQSKSSILNTNILTELKTNYTSIAQRNMLMSAELIRIMKLFEENNIEALAFKGPVLSQMAYGDITMRQYVDLDILVDEDDAYRAGKLMSENGNTTILPLNILLNATCLHSAKDFSLISETSKVHTELHWRLFEKKYNITLFSCTVKNKCQTVNINGKEIQTLQNELLLVYLCLHGAKHTFERIEWICDIDRLIRNVEINWKEAIVIAEKSHAKRSFYLGLSLAAQLFNTKLPPKIIRKSKDYHILALKEIVLKQLSEKKNEKSTFQNNKDIYYYQSKLFDSRRDQISFILNIIFSISTNDCRTFTLPKQLTFLYIVLRPLRLLYKYLTNTHT